MSGIIISAIAFALVVAFILNEQRAAVRMLREFEESFPGKCPICAFHRFGVRECLTDEPLPAPHYCLESGGGAVNPLPDDQTASAKALQWHSAAQESGGEPR